MTDDWIELPRAKVEALQAERDALQRRVAEMELRPYPLPMHDALNEAREEAFQMRAERDALVAALRKYAVHKGGTGCCVPVEQDCACGLDAIFAAFPPDAHGG